ncbi:hypothetical protein ACJRO7_007474 [Eucalyptus globulus]|uniref:Uncharacterized protein n=1 Tax=Eucalyptus globulus TaxID=34317 RepID=A0ABD3ILA8_EUCGL
MVFNLRTFSFVESVEDDPIPPKSFSLKELRCTTDNFSSKNIVVVFCSGKVYKERLADGSLVIVYRASYVNPLREDKFEVEVKVVSTVSMHPNVLHVRGFCCKYSFKCTLKNDVFAYGILLLDLIFGQPIIKICCKSFSNFGFMNKNELGRVIDPNLRGNYVEEEVEQLFRLALLCVDFNPSIRPKMSKVVTMIESQMLGQHPNSRSNLSGSEYDSNPSTPYYSFSLIGDMLNLDHRCLLQAQLLCFSFP